jgi:hypothetical protein
MSKCHRDADGHIGRFRCLGVKRRVLCRYGEEWGLTTPVEGSDYVWVLDPIDGTKKCAHCVEDTIRFIISSKVCKYA